MYSFEQMGYEDYEEMIDNSKPLSQIINEYSNSNDMKNKASSGNFIKLYIKAIIDINNDDGPISEKSKSFQEEMRDKSLKQIVDVVQEFDKLWKDAQVQKKRAELAELHLNHFLTEETE